MARKGKGQGKRTKGKNDTKKWTDTEGPVDLTNDATSTKDLSERSKKRQKRNQKQAKETTTTQITSRNGTQNQSETHQLSRACQDMRMLDKATANEGFGDETGFDIKGAKGYDGYTGYTWCSKYAFNKSRYNNFLKKEEEERLHPNS